MQEFAYISAAKCCYNCPSKIRTLAYLSFLFLLSVSSLPATLFAFLHQHKFYKVDQKKHTGWQPIKCFGWLFIYLGDLPEETMCGKHCIQMYQGTCFVPVSAVLSQKRIQIQSAWSKININNHFKKKQKQLACSHSCIYVYFMCLLQLQRLQLLCSQSDCCVSK